MEIYLENLKKYYGYVIAGVVIIILLLTFNFRITTIDKTAEDKLKIKESIIDELKEEIATLENETERQKMIANEWYEMWQAEKFSNEWLWEFYYKNVCTLEDEECKSGVYE